MRVINIEKMREVVSKRAIKKISKEVLDYNEAGDLKVFRHHIYEYQKGLRRLILTTEKDHYQKAIEERLSKNKIDFVINHIGKNKINVFFGAKDCVEIVKTFSPKLSELTAEQDFMLGIMLGYDRLAQCARYLKMKSANSPLFKNQQIKQL